MKTFIYTSKIWSPKLWAVSGSAMVLFGVFASGVKAQRTAPAGINPDGAWHMTVNVNKPGAAISPALYGLMTEEINHAYDGGLYGELVQNRSFRDNPNRAVHWSLVQGVGSAGAMTLDKTDGVNPVLGTSLKVDVTTSGKRVGVANEGYWGIPVNPQTTYRASFYAKGNVGPLRVGIESNNGSTTFAEVSTVGITPQWKKYTVTLKTGKVASSLDNRFVISTQGMGTFWLSFVSLFPPTYKDRPNGNRIDLMQKMADMSPAFLRLPGGNYVDPGHYEWKKAVGPLEQRPLGPGAWGYPSSYGLGLLEYLEWCEDLKMGTVLAVTDGRGWLPGNGDVGPLVQDALDEIEYVTGDARTPWGARRAADGHPTPFPLNYVEIGNEDFFDKRETYDARFARFYDAIRAKYPNLKIIATRNDVSSRRPDMVDDHIYASVTGMLRASHNYDNYDRKAPPVFVGEWATTVGSPTPTLKAALSDATYLMGLERNADVVKLASYAPLLVNVNPSARQWGTNLIGYNALTSFGSPSYYMQAMFNHNKGDVVLPTVLTPGAPEVSAPPVLSHGGVGVGTWNTQAEFKDAEVTQGDTTLLHTDFGATSGLNKEDGTWNVQDGTLSQTGTQSPALATLGKADWTDYTYKVKARKVGGAEGFLIPFHFQNNENRIWWNLGGWGNSRSAFEAVSAGNRTEFGNTTTTIETGRWYDIRIEVKGRQIRGYLDDKLVVDVQEPVPPVISPIYGGASRDSKNGDIILKIVNVGEAPHAVQIDLQGAGRVNKTAMGQFLVGAPGDVNTIEQPTKIVPQTLTLKAVGQKFTHEFPANSVSVFRIKTR
ncbi:extracellular exo-alpha-L-arabinofuranosidase [Abditibacteriota bacterium]|nr:extracellular exo-alpha-L-arabinofuranosidase [Abditibacteriota bacterium]